VISIDHNKKTVLIKDISNGVEKSDTYDVLVFATGAVPFVPPIPGIDSHNVFKVKNVNDADAIRNFIQQHNPKKAVIIGAGYIGLEMLENLIHLGIDTAVVERMPRVAPLFDSDISVRIESYLKKKNINVYLDTSVTEINTNDHEIMLSTGEKLTADLIISAVGIRPNTSLAENIGVELSHNKAIIVDKKMRTNLQNVYAVGDCAMSYSLITEKPTWIPLGSTANKMGRICGDVISGGTLEFKGILGTGIFKVFELGVAKTGLGEKEALDDGYEIEIIHNIKENQSKYLKESRELLIKAIADKRSGRLLGVQIVGENGVDKRIDVFATAMTYNAKVSDLFNLDLAYAPPYSTTKDPVMYTGMILDNALNRNRPILTVRELVQNREKFTVIDVRSRKDFDKGHIEGAIHIPLADIREKAEKLSKSDLIVTHCNKGVSGNAAQNILINLGFETVYNLSGGYKNYAITKMLY
jgi:NADPH-dependent 2,4-dienoyl-CoA reductase/sulfur reductase-like enzyme/rhodanese-related sulfurtransferase